MTHDSRTGFTMVELLVVVVVGAVLLTGIYQVLAVNQRAYTVQAAEMKSQQVVRASADVLFGELREVSPADGDLITMNRNSIEVRVARAFGAVCDADVTDVPQFEIVSAPLDFAVGDSVFILSDGSVTTSADDVWLAGEISSITGPGVCQGFPSRTLHFAGLEADVLANPVQLGAPIRGFTHMEYGLTSEGGEWYLGQAIGGGAYQPMVGPLLPVANDGLQFTYRDTFGDETAVPTEVARIEVSVRTQAPVTRFTGSQVADSLTFHIQTRN